MLDGGVRDGAGMILVAIGANLPAAGGQPPLATCEAAVRAIAALPGLRLIAVSRWYRSDPVPPSGQPPYVNGVARFAGPIAPASLLAALHRIEAEAGRVRSVPNAARPLDLDIIAMSAGEDDRGGLLRDAPDPVLPHPRAHLRGFVLRPLIEVAPDWVHPRLGASARALADALPPGGLQLL